MPWFLREAPNPTTSNCRTVGLHGVSGAVSNPVDINHVWALPSQCCLINVPSGARIVPDFILTGRFPTQLWAVGNKNNRTVATSTPTIKNDIPPTARILENATRICGQQCGPSIAFHYR